GYTTTDDPAATDVILLTTCAIREHAEERVVGRLTDLARLKARRRDLVLGMCGCMAQHHRAAVAARVPALDLVVGPDAYRRLPTLLAAARAVRADAHVPIRGRRRDDACDLAGLLCRAADVPGILRLRFTSPHPADMTPALIAAMAEVPAIAPQLHLPVQSGSDVVLARMERGHTVADYRNLVARLRDGVPEIALSTDVIVGFPGESPADFEATCRLIEEIGYDHAFLFKYSPRTLTKAARWDDSVDEEEKGRRLAHVIALQEQISAARNRRWIGRTVEVLVEGAARRSPGCVAGKTPQFLTTVVAAAAAPGTCLTAVVTGATAHTLIASAVDAAPDDRAPRAA